MLSQYHQKYSNYSDEEIQKRADEKENELEIIFENISLETGSEKVNLAVLGSGDKRFSAHHKRIFGKIIQKPVEVVTLDITIEHLDSEDKIIRHDCTLPLPGGPYDITYAHVLLKFIETEKQWNVIKNSYVALKEGGLAIHIMDKDDYATAEISLPDGCFSVPLERWKNKLQEEGIQFFEFSIKYGLALVLTK